MLKSEFSLLISVYVKEKPEYLEGCLQSVFQSTLLPSEVIIVKDGPITEQLQAVLNKYCELYDFIKIVSLEKNVGLGQALNEGMKYCNFKFVARMDTDDICDKDRFKTQLQIFMDNPEASLVGGFITEFIDTPDNIVSTRKVPMDMESIKKYARKRNPVNHVTVMFKKNDIIEVGGYQKVKDVGYEDYDLWIRLIMSGKRIINVDKIFVNVRVGQDMYQRRGDKKRLKTALYFRKKLWKIGYYSFFHYILYSCETIVFSCIPTCLRKKIYEKVLRK